MRPIFVIASKEIKTYLKAPSFYVLTGFYTLFLMFLFNSVVQNFRQRSMMTMSMGHQEGGLNFHNEVVMQHIGTINLLLIFLIPFLSIRLYTEEKKMRTFDLLLTSPITSTQIVLGKYLASVFVAAFFTAVSFLYPLAISIYAEPSWSITFSSYFGLLLMCMTYAAVGNFASSLSDNMFASGFIGLILNLSLWFVAWGTILFEDPIAKKIFEHISVSTHFQAFVQGNLQTAAIVFFLSIVSIYCFLTQRVVESARWR